MMRLLLPCTLVLALFLQAIGVPWLAHPARSAVLLPVATGETSLDTAERTALAVLRADQTGAVHIAAPYYGRPWLRDSFAWGMIPDDEGPLWPYAHTELAYWLTRQQPMGGWVSYKYSGWYDETPIYITAVLDAYRQTGDIALVREALPRLRQAWNWLYTSYVSPEQGSTCLLWAKVGPGGEWATDWADQVARQGYTPQLEGLWFDATRALAAMDHLVGDEAESNRHADVAACIARDINGLLWRVAMPSHINAPSVRPFGFFAAVPATADYLELDGNALILRDVATTGRRSETLAALASHAAYLLGGAGGGPARVAYGDYSPEDYGPIHNLMGNDRYQDAYWPTVGGLLAMAAARSDATSFSVSILRGIAARNQRLPDAFHEWYTSDGKPSGAALYGWGARMYILALYRAYAGIDDSFGINDPAGLILRAVPGPSRAVIVRFGHTIVVVNHGHGAFRYATIDGHIYRHAGIPSAALAGAREIDVYHG